MSDVLVFFLPRPPDIANGRASWQKVMREKRAYYEQLRTRMNVKHGFPPKPEQPIARAELAIVWHYKLEQHKPDADNAIRRMKYALDFLVAHGFLAGDSPKHVTWRTPVYRSVDDVREELPPLTTIRLTVSPVPS